MKIYTQKIIDKDGNKFYKILNFKANIKEYSELPVEYRGESAYDAKERKLVYIHLAHLSDGDTIIIEDHKIPRSYCMNLNIGKEKIFTPEELAQAIEIIKEAKERYRSIQKKIDEIKEDWKGQEIFVV